MHTFGTPDWASAPEQRINASSEFQSAASRWGVGFNGDVLLVFGPDDGWRETTRLLVRLERGRCGGAEFLNGEIAPEVGFEFAAPFGVWKDILESRVQAMSALLSGALRVRGEKATLLRHTGASRALMECAAAVETTWK